MTTGLYYYNARYYDHGGQMVAMKQGNELKYVHQEHLTSTSLMTGSDGVQIGTTMRNLPFGNCRNSPNLPTDKLFTGQRLDATGLYYYNARYYDPERLCYTIACFMTFEG